MIKKSPTRTFSPQKILKGRSYKSKELSKLCNVDKSVIHRWKREEGLISIDNQTPSMFYWKTIKQFLEYKNNSRKMPSGYEGSFPCFKCSLKRRAFQDQIIVIKRNKKLWQAKAFCSVCGAKMNLGVESMHNFKP